MMHSGSILDFDLSDWLSGTSSRLQGLHNQADRKLLDVGPCIIRMHAMHRFKNMQEVVHTTFIGDLFVAKSLKNINFSTIIKWKQLVNQETTRGVEIMPSIIEE